MVSEFRQGINHLRNHPLQRSWEGSGMLELAQELKWYGICLGSATVVLHTHA